MKKSLIALIVIIDIVIVIGEASIRGYNGMISNREAADMVEDSEEEALLAAESLREASK